jgi:hypothetical protein
MHERGSSHFSVTPTLFSVPCRSQPRKYVCSHVDSVALGVSSLQVTCTTLAGHDVSARLSYPASAPSSSQPRCACQLIELAVAAVRSSRPQVEVYLSAYARLPNGGPLVLLNTSSDGFTCTHQLGLHAMTMSVSLGRVHCSCSLVDVLWPSVMSLD